MATRTSAAPSAVTLEADMSTGCDSHPSRSDSTAMLACSLLIPTSIKRRDFFLKTGLGKLRVAKERAWGHRRQQLACPPCQELRGSSASSSLRLCPVPAPKSHIHLWKEGKRIILSTTRLFHNHALSLWDLLSYWGPSSTELWVETLLYFHKIYQTIIQK